ncbi:Rtr1/RPAP2 family-domain-containing protein [Jimgerdemannia flammicorona]|uniref:RNA polymerase II subunit B1 CTD phosphatase RPAP2 homolog n=1 Tax=Jimgerdemannia flammicorona TaxID=994334 RepID=A0A433BAH1_9FUNG|nr:Rtr1/RPAP2 family-domain-containing protein [Jimgerdemannia flammicorona]
MAAVSFPLHIPTMSGQQPRPTHLTPDYAAPRTLPLTHPRPGPKKKRPTARRNGPRPPTSKQILVRTNLEHRLASEQLTLTWQERLFSVRAVSLATLADAARHFRPVHYRETVEERNLEDWCGYPLCENDRVRIASKYRIALNERKVYDQTELGKFCSRECLKRSAFYEAQLIEEPVWARGGGTWREVRVVGMNEDASQIARHAVATTTTTTTTDPTTTTPEVSAALRMTYVHSLLATLPSALSDLTIHEKTITTPPTAPVAAPTVASAMRADAPDAIEGFRIGFGKGGGAKQTQAKKQVETEMEIEKEKESEGKILDVDDEEALVRDAMETMMMLRRMGLDGGAEKQGEEAVGKKEERMEEWGRFEEERQAGKEKVKDKENEEQKQKQKREKKLGEKNNKKEDQKAPLQANLAPSIPAEPFLNPQSSVAVAKPHRKSTNEDPRDSSPAPLKPIAISINTAAAPGPVSPTSSRASKRKRAPARPQMSFFGRVWTMLDRMVTRRTRRFLKELEENDQGYMGTVGEEREDEEEGEEREVVAVRRNILSEKVLET